MFQVGDVITLSASASRGSFTGWAGACRGTGACTVTLAPSTLVVATFAVPPPTVTQYSHPDILGSVRAMTATDGTVLRRHDSPAFGEEIASEEAPPGLPAAAKSQRFTGKERDGETGLDYFGARYYASRTGRFTTVDPGHVGGNIFDPQSWNGYAYARNNPLRFVDPTGTDYYVMVDGGQPFWVEGNESALQPFEAGGFSFNNGFIFNAAGRNVGSYQYFSPIGRLASDISGRTAGVVEAIGVVVTTAEFALGVANPVASAAAHCITGNCGTGAALAMIPPLRFTRMMLSTARVIARGDRIQKVDQLVAKFGGRAKNWVKMSAVDAAGREIHWYQHPGIGKVGIKLAGQPDPF